MSFVSIFSFAILKTKHYIVLLMPTYRRAGQKDLSHGLYGAVANEGIICLLRIDGSAAIQHHWLFLYMNILEIPRIILYCRAIVSNSISCVMCGPVNLILPILPFLILAIFTIISFSYNTKRERVLLKRCQWIFAHFRRLNNFKCFTLGVHNKFIKTSVKFWNSVYSVII